MTSLDFAALPAAGKSQLALTLAAFILNDAKLPLNADNLNKVLKAANVEADAGLSKTFASVLEATPVDKFLKVGGAGGAGPAQAAAPAKDEKKNVEMKKQAAEPEPEPEVDMDMGDMFG